MPRITRIQSYMTLGLFLIVSTTLPAQQLKRTLEDLDVGDRWSYNDWESAKAAAQESKKPILALFR